MDPSFSADSVQKDPKTRGGSTVRADDGSENFPAQHDPLRRHHRGQQLAGQVERRARSGKIHRMTGPTRMLLGALAVMLVATLIVVFYPHR
jgi:hypothetical protein